MGIIRPDVATIVQLVADSHLQGNISSADSCWAGLRFIKDHLHSYLDSEVASTGKREDRMRCLQSCLLAPCSEGALVSVAQLSVRGVLGVGESFQLAIVSQD